MHPTFGPTRLAALRRLARTVLLTEGVGLAPGAPVPDALDSAIDDLAHHLGPDVTPSGEALLTELADQELARRISDHRGSLMAAYGDAGFFVGLAVGLEAAALVGSAVTTSANRDAQAMPTGGRR